MTEIPLKKECKEGKCKVIPPPNSTIYDPEKVNSNKKMCDCIIQTENKVFVVEILCGILTNTELKDKEIQVKNGFALAEKYFGNTLEFEKFILYSKKSGNHLEKRLIPKKITELRSRGIKVQQFVNFKIELK